MARRDRPDDGKINPTFNATIADRIAAPASPPVQAGPLDPDGIRILIAIRARTRTASKSEAATKHAREHPCGPAGASGPDPDRAPGTGDQTDCRRADKRFGFKAAGPDADHGLADEANFVVDPPTVPGPLVPAVRVVFHAASRKVPRPSALEAADRLGATADTDLTDLPLGPAVDEGSAPAPALEATATALATGRIKTVPALAGIKIGRRRAATGI
jgi:hypothetical protein